MAVHDMVDVTVDGMDGDTAVARTITVTADDYELDAVKEWTRHTVVQSFKNTHPNATDIRVTETRYAIEFDEDDES